MFLSPNWLGFLFQIYLSILCSFGSLGKLTSMILVGNLCIHEVQMPDLSLWIFSNLCGPCNYFLSSLLIKTFLSFISFVWRTGIPTSTCGNV